LSCLVLSCLVFLFSLFLSLLASLIPRITHSLPSHVWYLVRQEPSEESVALTQQQRDLLREQEQRRQMKQVAVPTDDQQVRPVALSISLSLV
jgi:uncharacterized iron-regulated membrane protein